MHIKMIKAIYNMLDNVAAIFRNKTTYSKKSNILRDYIKTLYHNKNKKEISISNFRIKYANYELFKCLYKDIFIKNDYLFISKKEDPLIIDCGSNIGMSILFFKKLYPQSKIIAFEPDEHAFKLLQENMEINKITSVEAHNVALNNKPGFIDLYIEHGLRGSLRTNTTKHRLESGKVIIKKVKSEILSKYIHKNVDLLKMDVEGAEPLIIEELNKENKLKLINKIIMEFHHNIGSNKSNLPITLSILERSGFKYMISSPLKKSPVIHTTQDIMIYAYRQ